MSAAAKRTWVIEPLRHPETGEQVVDEQRLEDLLGQLIATLIAVGGLVEIVADRVKVGTLPDGEPLAETLGFVVKWRTIPVLHARSMTAGLMDAVLGASEVPAEGEAHVHSEEQLAAAREVLGQPDVEVVSTADDDEEECDCAGDHVPPCPYAVPVPVEEAATS